MKKKNLSKYLAERYIVDSPEEIIDAIVNYLYDKADEIEREEPYAVNSIRKIREAAYEVSNIEE